MLESTKNFNQGIVINANDADFSEAIKAAVDYRGDITLKLKTGLQIEGFLFNSSQGRLDLFPKNSPQKQSVEVEEVEVIEFSGKDEAAGKSWEEYMAKKKAKENN